MVVASVASRASTRPRSPRAAVSSSSAAATSSSVAANSRSAERIGETAAAKALEERHRAWAERVPANSDDLWDFVTALGDEERMSLLAHRVAGTVCAVQQRWDTKRGSLALVDTLAEAVSLNMAAHWEPTVDSYLGRVTKAHIAQAVREGVSNEAAERITRLKKQPMAKAAEELMAGAGWLPSLLRTVSYPGEEEGRG